jgi:hypothetical protein
MNRFIQVITLLALGVGGTGCSLTVDSEVTQCKNPADCDKFDSPYALTCKQNVCVRDDVRQCRLSDVCGESEYCEKKTGQCVLAPPCKEREDCMAFAGAEDFACISNVCEPARCEGDAQCMRMGANFVCEGGQCLDPIWGCRGQPDPREGADEDNLDAVFRIQVLYAPTQNMEEVPIRNLVARVCLPGDPNCTQPAGKKPTYDPVTGWLEVTGLRNNNYYNIKLSGEGPEGVGPVLPGTIVMYRPVVGLTEEKEPALMFTAGTRDLFGGLLKVPIDSENMGLVVARVFDCKGNSAAKVSLNVEPNVLCVAQPDPMKECRTKLFYFDKENLPDEQAQMTDAAGVAGAINTQTKVDTTFFFTLDGENKEYAKKTFVLQPNEVTYLAIYPGVYP